MRKIITLLIITVGLNSNAQCWRSISAENNHVAAIKEDGTLWVWGANNAYQLGDNTTASKNAPTQIGTSTNWQSVAVGFAFTIAIKTDGTLWGWGQNGAGQLGDGTTVNRSVPVQIGTETNWSFVSAGEQHVVAKKTDGTLWTWGALTIHIEEDPVVDTYSTVPVQIGTGFDWTTSQISAGGYHNLALKPDGTLWGWGNNSFNQLGNGNTTDINTPTQIGTATDWKAIGTGTGSSFGIKTNGTLYAWGAPDARLGLGILETTVSVPAQVGTATDWKLVEGGNLQTIALKTTGELYTWGGNDYGQIGDATTTERSVPTKIGTVTDWSIVTSGDSQNYAIKTDGSLFSTGYNIDGQLGDASNTNKSVFTSVTCPSSTLSSSEVVMKANFSVYPNPVSTVLNFQFDNEMAIDKIIITDLTGKIMLQQTNNFANVNVEYLADGMYFVQAFSGDTKWQSKFIKE